MTVLEHPEVASGPLSELAAAKFLKGKRALVTGGSRGIGRATVLALAQAGADVSINYQRCGDLAEAVCGLAHDLGVAAHAYQCDVSNDDDVQAMMEKIAKDSGPVDILVNNAGITRDKSFVKMNHAMWDEVLRVNLNGVFNVTHAALPSMIEGGWGRIINVSSIVGQTGSFGQTNYAATKGGLISFTMALARETARKGITVNAVAPGYIETDMVKDMPAPALESVKAATPVGRLGRAEEVAAAIAFLASPQASYITGQVIPVNGGMYM